MVNREQQADAALWDFGTRQGATSDRVINQMKKAGFTKDEIMGAVERMRGSGSD